MRKTELIFIPAPAPGHIIPTVEFSKRLVAHDSRLSVTVLVIKPPYFPGVTINQLKPTSPSQEGDSSHATSGIRYIELPQVDPPPFELFKESMEHSFHVYLASYVPHVRDAITRLQSSFTTDGWAVRVAGLVVDMFCTPMIDIANELGLPSYVYFCSNAAFLGLLLHLPSHPHQVGTTQFNESSPDTIVPCFQNPVPSWVFPIFSFNKLGCRTFMDQAKKFKEAKGILINTFAELEPYALKFLSVAHQTAPVYTVGPVLNLDDQIQYKPCEAAERVRIMRWLDKQPESSVVLLCFGSGGYFSEEQVREISKGLSQSGQRFIWSLRKPPTGHLLKPTEYTEMEMKGVLTDEFWPLLVEERGLVCGWAPQAEILAHKSIGAFVSHCGWNSTLESLWFGKPIVTWPLYAEQQMNAFALVRELGIAVELTLDYRLRSSSLVEADQVERAVRSVMDKDNAVRYKVKEMSEICREALMEGGSSYSCVDLLIRNIMGETQSQGDY